MLSTREVQELVNYYSKFGGMNYAKMAAEEPDIEGVGDHLLWGLIRSGTVSGSSRYPVL